jgi:RHS repeat-associated protein
MGLMVWQADRVARRASCFFLLAALLWCLPALAIRPDFQETRVGGCDQFTSGQASATASQALENAMGCGGCGYENASGQANWLNHDPIGEAGDINLYTFNRNSPVNFVDPYGLDPWYSWLNPFSYSSGWAQSQGVQALNAQLAANNTSLQQFQLDNPTWNGNGNLTAGNMQAAQAGANLGAAAANGEINLYGAILPGGIAAKEGEEAAAAARAAMAKDCPKKTPWGWTGQKPWKDAAKALQSAGTHMNLNGTVPTLDQAMELLEEAGVDLNSPEVRLEEGHGPPNPHDFPHINYPAPNGGKGTIQIQP